METPSSQIELLKIAESLVPMIRFADETKDFVLAAKLDDARDTVMQRYNAAIQ
jgi:hypothetical protein